MKKFPIPTGYLLVDNYSKGELETLSIGDYGKIHNIKANFLGINRPLNGVPNMPCMPLSEKWVVTLSTQYGCRMACTFCDCPKVEWKGNAHISDLWSQLGNALRVFPKVPYCERLNIHFARMGEPIFNEAVFEFARELYVDKARWNDIYSLRVEVVHPVLTTCLPRYNKLQSRILEWTSIKNDLYNGQAGLQFSINSTDEEQRQEMFGGKTLKLEEISEIGKEMPIPTGRKYCLNFAYATGYKIDADRLRRLFCPSKFMVKITPIHNNDECRKNGIETIGGYDSFEPYQAAEESLIEKGFDVIIFVPSMDEENSLVTCGNAVLGGGKITTDSIINIMGISK